MKVLPTALKDTILDYVERQLRACALLVDADGALLEWYGPVERYGLVDLERGAPVTGPCEWLSGFIPTGDGRLSLPGLSIAGAEYFDAHLLPDGERTWVLILDASSRTRLQTAAQQMAYELALLRRGHAARPSEEARWLSQAIHGLGLAVLTREPDGAFRAREPVPAWFAGLFPGWLGRAEADGSDFLGHFLVEAEAFWAGAEPGPLRSGEWVELAPDGRELRCEAIAVRIDGGSPAIFVYAMLETDERRRILQAARENRLELRRLARDLEHKDVLLHCIVHDLAGPLTSIQGALEILGRGEPAPAARKRLIDIGVRQSRELESRIRQILGVFRAEVEALEAFTVDPTRAPDVLASAHELAEAMSAAFAARRIRLVVEPPLDPGDPWRVVGQSGRLERVLSNLLENALRHAPAGSDIEVTLARTDAEVTVQIADRGPGVPEAARARLFDKFAQGAQSGKGGLGLYFCRMTLERWGGRIAHEPREGGGAVFVVHLRRALAT